MKTQRINSGIYIGILAMALCLSSEVSAANNGPSNSLRFHGNDGWSRPSMERSEDNMIVTLRFHKTPKDAAEKLESLLTENKRTVFTQAEYFPQKRGALVRLSLSRRAKKLTRKRSRNHNWLVTVQLETEKPIPSASYATLIPNGLERIAYEESERDLETTNPRCAVFHVLKETKASWSSFALLSLMDCYQTRRNPRKARQIALDIRKDRHASSIVHILATLRLNEWPKQKPLRVRRELTREEQMNLPVGIAQEAGLRLTRVALRQNRNEEALNHFMAAVQRGTMDSKLASSAQELRLRLLVESTKKNDAVEILTLVDALPLPPLDHVSYPGTARISAIALAEAGRADEAADAATGIINTEGVLIDRKLGRCLFHAFTRAGLFEEVHWVSHLVEPKDVFFATQASLEPLSAPSSSILAMWVMKTWDSSGPLEAARLSQPTERLKDTPGILSEARGAALLGARECNKITKSNDLNKALASVCFLASGESQTASDIWSTEKNTEPTDTWTWAVRNHVVASASFFEEMNGVDSNYAGRTN